MTTKKIYDKNVYSTQNTNSKGAALQSLFALQNKKRKKMITMIHQEMLDLAKALVEIPSINGTEGEKDIGQLQHTTWRCQYHVVFAPKYRRKVVYGKLRKDIGEILRRLCDYKHVEIIEAHAMPDHIHMLLSIPPSLCVSEFMGYLKGKSTLMIFERHANLKYKYGKRTFWAKRILCKYSWLE